MRQIEVAHEAHEVALPDPVRDTRVEPALLGHTARREPAVIMRRVDQALSRQRHDLVADRAKHRMRIALLEVRAPRATDHEAIAREREAGVIENIRQAATRMTGCRAHLNVAGAE